MINNPLWSIERALRHGYVMEPHFGSGDFSGPLRMSRPSHSCALVTAHIRRCISDPAMKDQDWGREACTKQCDECASICHMNDYIRAKPHCPPNYPMPATLETTEIALLYLHLALCPLYYNGKQSVPCEVCIDRYLDDLELLC